jgi:hypothetical protein
VRVFRGDQTGPAVLYPQKRTRPLNTRVATVPMMLFRGVSVHHHALLFRYGRGHCAYDDGRVFVGEWRGDEWYGYGSLYMPDGCAVVNAHWIAHERAPPPH